jgi:menaquinone-dependent protoporphyrinogen oxidase
MVTAMRAPVGDFRDWELIAAWARQIAAELTAAAPARLPSPAASSGLRREG